MIVQNQVSMSPVNHFYRQDGYQLLISSGQMIDADEELQLSAAPWLWRNHHSSSTLLARPISISLPPQHNLLPLEPTRHSTLAPFASFVSECQNEAERTRLISTVQEILSVIQMDSSAVSRQDAVDQHNRLIIFCDEILPLQLFGAPCYTKDCIMSIGDTGWHSNDKKSSDKLSHSHNNTNNSKDLHHELVGWDKICNAKSLLKPCSAPGALFGRDQNVKRRKSVSFDDDVMVYLFDQVPSFCCLFSWSVFGGMHVNRLILVWMKVAEAMTFVFFCCCYTSQESPTVELSSGPHAALPNSHLYNLPGVTTEDGRTITPKFYMCNYMMHIHTVRHTVITWQYNI